MTTLSQLYKQKEKNGTGTTVKKTFMVPITELYLAQRTRVTLRLKLPRRLAGQLLMLKPISNCFHPGKY